MHVYNALLRSHPKKGRLTIQCGELWQQQLGRIILPNFDLSFVDNKRNEQWVWLALDVVTREIIGVYVGARDEAGAQGLWDSIPPIYR